MAIAVVQSVGAGGATPTFGSNVTAGNTVFVCAGGYGNSGTSILSSAPTLGGSPVSNSVAKFNSGGSNGIQSAAGGGSVAYATIWMLPNCPGGVKAISITISGNTGGATTGCVAFEVSGLGATPVFDQSSSGSAGTGTAVSSGTTPAILTAPEFIVGVSQIFNQSGAGPAGWTSLVEFGGATTGGRQIATSSGGTYSWAQTGNSSGPWVAAIATAAAALGGGPFNVTTTPAVIQSAPASSSPGIQGQAILTSLSGSVYLGGGTAVSSTNGAQVATGGVPLTIPLFGSDSIYAVASSGTVTASILPGGN